MKKIIFSFLILAFNLNAGIHQEGIFDYKVDRLQGHALEVAKSISATGVLKKKSNGYYYLDISNEYITKIFPILILDGHLRPTDSFGSEEGAHITVVTDGEKCEGLEAEVGKEFTFEVLEFRTVTALKSYAIGPGSYHTGDRWMIAVQSPELEELRMKYGLQPLVNRHDFHISIGFEVPFNRINNFGTTPKPQR